jgi:hypothetical protein
MRKYRVSWIESRVHYIDVEAEDKFDAIEEARNSDYGETASDASIFDKYSAIRITDKDVEALEE